MTSLHKEVGNILYSPCVSITIDTESDFRHIEDLFQGGDWIFRGHTNAGWFLKTTLERSLADKGDKRRYSRIDEMCAIKEFAANEKNLCKDSFSDIEYLAVMQHYGRPTRLLDFTPNIRKALFFSEAYEKGSAHAIWAVRLNAIYGDYRIFQEDFTTSFTLPIRQYHKRMMIFPSTYTGISKRPFYEYLIKRANANIHAIELEYENKIKPGVQPLFVDQNNPRQIEQEGIFLFSNNFNSFVDNLAYSMDVDSNNILSPPEIGSVRYFENMKEHWNRIVLVKMVLGYSFANAAQGILERAQISKETMLPERE